MRKTVLTWNMLLSYIVGIIMLMEPIKQYLWSVITGVKTYVTNPVNLVFTCFALGGYLLFTPLITALPGAAVFVDDYNSGYIKSILTRMSRKKYVLYRLTSCMISGGVAVCLPVITLFLISLVTSNLGNSRENIINLLAILLPNGLKSAISASLAVISALSLGLIFNITMNLSVELLMVAMSLAVFTFIGGMLLGIIGALFNGAICVSAFVAIYGLAAIIVSKYGFTHFLPGGIVNKCAVESRPKIKYFCI